MHRIQKSTETESRTVVAWGWLQEGMRGFWRMTAIGYGAAFVGNEKVLKLIVLMVA